MSANHFFEEEEDFSQVVERFLEHKENIDRTIDLISKGKGVLAESEERVELAVQRTAALREERIGGLAPVVDEDLQSLFLERQIGKTNDIVSTEFFEFGLLAQRAVGRVSYLSDQGQANASGFLVTTRTR